MIELQRACVVDKFIPKKTFYEKVNIFNSIKEKYNSKNLIKVITKNIPYPILFFIKYEGEFQYAIKYN